MLKAEFSNEAATECYKAAQYIIDRLGVDQDLGKSSDFRSYSEGELVIAKTNTGHIEIRYKNEIGLSVSPHGAGERPTWRPGDWVQEVDRIYQRALQS